VFSGDHEYRTFSSTSSLAISSITSDVYKIILDDLEPRGHLGNVMSFLRQITKSAPRPAFAGDCADYRPFGGNDACSEQKLAISSRHMSRSVELTWRRT
jgi:hypothetical protein